VTDQLAGLFTGDDGGRAVALFSVGTLTAWNANTFANTVTTSDGVIYSNLAVCLSFGAAAGVADYWETGDRVLLAQTAGAPVIISTLWRPGPAFPL
jgi:hypothetical protein